jgi:hypothetical protein
VPEIYAIGRRARADFLAICVSAREVMSANGSSAQQVRGGTSPPRLFCHYYAHARSYRVGFNNLLDRPATIFIVSQRECAR